MKKLILLILLVVSVWHKAAALDNLDTVYMRQQTYIIDQLQFSPDDKYILVQNFGNTCIIESATGTTIFTKEYMAYPVWKKNGKHFIALQQNAKGIFWVTVETDTWKTVDSFPAGESFEVFSVSPDERMVAIKVPNDAIAFYDLVEKKKIKQVKYYYGPDFPKPNDAPILIQMVWSGDGKHLIYTAADGRLRFWDVEQDKVVYTYAAGYGVLTISDDYSKIAFKTGKAGYAVQVMEVTTKQIVAELTGKPQNISGISFSSNGEYLAVAMREIGRLNVYKVKSMEQVREWA